MASPVYAIAYRDAGSAIRRTLARFWVAFQPHRKVSTTLGLSAAAHVAVLLLIGTALYDDGEDAEDIPQLSVQLETRVGPNDEEFSEAALPHPTPDPVDDVLDDPGTHSQTVDAPALQAAHAASEPATEALPPDDTAATPAANSDRGAVVTTIGASEHAVAKVEQPAPEAAAHEMPATEQAMVTREVQQLAQKMLDSDLTRAELAWEQDGRQYTARVTRQPATDSTGIEQVTAEVMTNQDGRRLKTRLTLKRLAFSHFTQLLNHWDRGVQLHADVIDGRFHSNTEISFLVGREVSPRFFGKVTTAARTLTFDGQSRRRHREVFQGGYETRAERVLLPRDMPEVTAGGEPGDRRVFTEDTRIIFNADGSYVWRRADGRGELHREGPGPRPRYLIADAGAKLYVRGTVSGLFTVYSPGDIEIEDDLVYSEDPRQTLLSRDFLALIAGRDISIAEPSVTGSGDLTIHGALFARRRFEVELFEHARAGQTLVIYGSLTAGTMTASEPRYATRVDFDKRFEYLRPASFPMTRRYEVESRDPGWEDAGAGDSRENLARSQ